MPETARDAAPVDGLAGAIVPLLSVVERDISADEDETTDDQQAGDSTETITSKFFHENRFEPLLSENSERVETATTITVERMATTSRTATATMTLTVTTPATTSAQRNFNARRARATNVQAKRT